MEFPPVMEIEPPLYFLASLSLPFLQARQIQSTHATSWRTSRVNMLCLEIQP